MGCQNSKQSGGSNTHIAKDNPSKTEQRGAEALRHRESNKKKKAHDVKVT